MKCKACGAELTSKKQKCPQCGHKEKSKAWLLLLLIPAALLVILLVIGALLLVLGVAGVGIFALTKENKAEPIPMQTIAPVETEAAATEPTVFVTEPDVFVPVMPTVAPTEAPTEAPATIPQESYAEVSYRITVSRADFPIYNGPGYDTGFAQYFKEEGVFTIVEECRRSDGSCWGRLKSGVGWVDLVQLEREEAQGEVISLMPVGTVPALCRYCYIATDEYGQIFTVRANVSLASMEIVPLTINGGYEEDTPMFADSGWSAGEGLSVEASFPGDTSAFGIRATDYDGVVYHYIVMQDLSGDGSLFFMDTYAPGPF